MALIVLIVVVIAIVAVVVVVRRRRDRFQLARSAVLATSTPPITKVASEIVGAVRIGEQS